MRVTVGVNRATRRGHGTHPKQHFWRPGSRSVASAMVFRTLRRNPVAGAHQRAYHRGKVAVVVAFA
jgi:hypothetical protein